MKICELRDINVPKFTVSIQSYFLSKGKRLNEFKLYLAHVINVGSKTT